MLVIGGFLLGLFFWISWATTGRTVGNELMGLRVVSFQGRLMRWSGALLRAIFCVLLPIGPFRAVVSRQNRSIQDAVLRSSVIHDWGQGRTRLAREPRGTSTTSDVDQRSKLRGRAPARRPEWQSAGMRRIVRPSSVFWPNTLKARAPSSRPRDRSPMGTADLDARSSGSGLPTLEVLLFDVYGTLSDMSPLGGRFVDVGAPAHLAPTWLTALLLDGFALTAARAPAHFTQLAVGTLRTALDGLPLNRAVDEAVEHIMGGFDELEVQGDVPAGLAALVALGPRLVTLSNGDVSVAEQLFERTGLSGHFERQLSTDDAGIWKPAPAAYAYAAGRCRSRPAAMMLVAAHPWDIDGAHRAGLRTAWINRTGAPYPEYFSTPTLEAQSLTHLAHLLGG